MNLFILDTDPFKAAQYYQDLHLNKIIVEGTQVLATAYPLTVLQQADCPRTQKGTPRKHSHYNHPVTKWVRTNINNFVWTLNHVDALYQERLYRFNKQHFSRAFIDWCWSNPPELPHESRTEHPQCFVNTYPELVVINDPVKGYQNYYNVAKRSFQFGKKTVNATWTKRDTPYFFTSNDIST